MILTAVYLSLITVRMSQTLVCLEESNDRIYPRFERVNSRIHSTETAKDKEKSELRL